MLDKKKKKKRGTDLYIPVTVTVTVTVHEYVQGPNSSTAFWQPSHHLHYPPPWASLSHSPPQNAPFSSSPVSFEAAETKSKLEHDKRMKQSRNKRKERTYLFLPPLFNCCVCKQIIVVSLTHAEGWCQSLNIDAIKNGFFGVERNKNTKRVVFLVSKRE